MFDLIVRTRDWHPTTHVSFAANHPEMKVFQIKYLADTGVDQVMWPVHCVQGSRGADFHRELIISNCDFLVSKGQLDRVDSYSGFGSRPEITNLESILRENNVTKVYCVGLAFDYCVGSTARDAAELGFDTYLIKDATRSVAVESEQKMMSSLIEAGVKIINSIQTKQRT
jgi:nicotinamidase/pyrazinamidase